MRNESKKIILELVKLSGIVAVGLLIPNAVKLFAKKHPKKFYRLSRMTQTIRSLEKQGLLKNTPDGLMLTSAGNRKLLSIERPLIVEKQKKKWDGKWYIVMFDVWESRRRTRDLLRDELRGYGFIKIQNSVWVYPFDCLEFVALLKEDLAVGRGILCFHGKMMDPDRSLRASFGL